MEKFQIIQPSSLLAPYVKQYWFLKTDDVSRPQRIIPNGSVCLVFHRENHLFSISKNEPQPRAFISGQSVGYSDLSLTGSVDMISVTFHPHGAKAFFSMPLNELYGATVAVGEVSDRGLLELQDRLMYAEDERSCVQLIEAFLLRRLQIAKGYNHQRLSAVIQAINSGEMDIRKLAETSCLGYKQFQRLFREYVGANPKEFLRIIRFQRALFTLQCRPQIPLTQLSYECGCYDQPHLIKEFKVFSGYTPGEYISLCTPYSDYFF